jgi:CRISPR system Cascade subunit CasE
MYFSKIELNRAVVGVRDLVRLSVGDGYQIHRRIWAIFSDGLERRRDFLYRHEATQGWPKFYTVSERPPEDSTGLWNLASKPYQPRLSAGEKLSFSLRANPVRTKRDAEKRQHRHDVVMEAKTRLVREGRERIEFSLPEIIQEEGSAWLLSRAERHGFAVDPDRLRVDGYQQHVLYKKRGKISFSTLDFNGILIVTDPGLFERSLYHGLGPAKGFGCGLMMVRRL